MAQPELECDLIMRGGIASGLVYPTAVAELAKTHTFRSLGGTSAGAIAAAATAAAEYGRRENAHPDPFGRLATIPEELGSRSGGRMARSKLFRLFRSQSGTAPLYWLVVTLMGSMRDRTEVQLLKVITTLFQAFPLAALFGAFPGFFVAGYVLAHSHMLKTLELSPVALVFWSAFFVVAVALLQVLLILILRSLTAVLTIVVILLIAFGVHVYRSPEAEIWGNVNDLAHVVGAMFLIYVGAGGATLSCAYAAVRRAQRELPRNMYGLCAGFGGKRPDGTPQLTQWLNDLIQELAGRKPDDPPLTVGDLKGTLKPGERDTSISLALMTTDITRGTSHTFPQLEGVGGWRGTLYFKASDFARLFPKSVVDWMISKSGPALQLVDERGKPSGVDDVYRLPAPNDLPIIVGTRMSMSFPFLLSTVPLYTPDKTDADDVPITVHRLWFSDGGLASNFPIHFFDSMVPQRPTFGISLAYDDNVFRNESLARLDGFTPSKDWLDFGGSVLLPSTNHEGAFTFARLVDFEKGAFKVSGFFSALFDASRAWVDNELINMPGYRDRIVHVRLSSDEGGYNLDMPADVIKRIAVKGRLAGEMLAARFAPEPGPDPKTGRPIELTWDNHRWIRYRGFMSALEALARQFTQRWQLASMRSRLGGASLKELIDRSEPPANAGAYPWGSEDHFKFAKKVTQDLADFVAGWTAPYQTFDWDDGRPPQPKLRLRVTPPDETS